MPEEKPLISPPSTEQQNKSDNPLTPCTLTNEEMMKNIYERAGVRKLLGMLPQKASWIWYPYIPRGKVTIIQGDPGEGKTTLSLAIAAQLSRGRMFGDTRAFFKTPVSVVYQTAEDGYADTVVPRLMNCGADLNRIFCMYEKPDEEMLTFTSSKIEEVIQLLAPAAMIFDPIQAFLGAGVDMHRANEIRPVMAYLSELAETYGTAIILIGHQNKAQGGKSIYRGLGSIDIAAAARSVLQVERCASDPSLKLVKHVKSSLAPFGDTVAFAYDEEGHFINKGLYIPTDPEEASSGRQTATQQAESFLYECITETPQEAAQLLSEASKLGISESALKNAKKNLNIKSKRADGKWFWYKPAPPPEEKDEPETEPLTTQTENPLTP